MSVPGELEPAPEPKAGGNGAGSALLTVIGGYLGAGKTTLVNRLLAGAGGQRVAVVVNDFGAVGVDAGLIRSRTEDTIELTNGCLCCSLADDLAGVMTALADREPRLDHVVVEMSGVGQPSAMTAWGWFPGFRPGRTVVCADALSGRARAADRWTGDVVLAQLLAADVVIVTKCDLAGEVAAWEFEKWLATVAPGAAIVRGSPDLDVTVVLQENSAEPPPTASGPVAGDDADDDYVTWSATGRGVVRREALEAFLRTLDRGIVRVKGIVRLAEAPGRRTVVQGVAGRWELTDGGPWAEADEPPRLVLIALRHEPPDRARSGLLNAGQEASRVLGGPVASHVSSRPAAGPAAPAGYQLRAARQQADQQVDEILGGGGPFIRAKVAALLQAGDAVGTGQEQRTVQPGLPGADDPGHDLEEEVLSASGGPDGRSRIGGRRREHEPVQVRPVLR